MAAQAKKATQARAPKAATATSPAAAAQDEHLDQLIKAKADEFNRLLAVLDSELDEIERIQGRRPAVMA